MGADHGPRLPAQLEVGSEPYAPVVAVLVAREKRFELMAVPKER